MVGHETLVHLTITTFNSEGCAKIMKYFCPRIRDKSPQNKKGTAMPFLFFENDMWVNLVVFPYLTYLAT